MCAYMTHGEHMSMYSLAHHGAVCECGRGEEHAEISDPFSTLDSIPESFINGHLFNFVSNGGWEALLGLGLVSVSPVPTLEIKQGSSRALFFFFSSIALYTPFL